MLRETGGKRPRLGKGAFASPMATISGDCELAEGASAWHGTVVRGDLAREAAQAKELRPEDCP